jgi:hypothetical protein
MWFSDQNSVWISLFLYPSHLPRLSQPAIFHPPKDYCNIGICRRPIINAFVSVCLRHRLYVTLHIRSSKIKVLEHLPVIVQNQLRMSTNRYDKRGLHGTRITASTVKYCGMTPESRNSEVRNSLLGNDSVDTFPRQRIRKQQSSNFRCYTTAL